MRHVILTAVETSFPRSDRPRRPSRSSPGEHRLLNLQRSIGNQAVGRLLRSPYIRSTQRPTVQRQPGTDYGLAAATSRNKYVAKAVELWTTKGTLTLKAFADELMTAIVADAVSQGVPTFTWKMQPGLGVSGSFDQKTWMV